MRLSEEEYQGLIAKKQPSKNKPMYALGRLKQGEMNKLEAEYNGFLETQKHLGLILWFKFEGIKFRLADKTFYTPDFAVMMSTGEMEVHETKGFMMEDANVKIKVAASLYPFKFKLIKKRAAKNGGGWDVKEY